MKAVYFEEFRTKPTVEDVPDPECPRDGVIVKVAASGICRSDWHGWMGHDDDVQLPHVPGHEFAGTVIEKGSNVANWSVEDRVTVPFSMGCGRCEQCETGNHQVCDNYYQPGFTGWGSFAEFVSLPSADVNLVRLPDSLSFDNAATLGCRFVTAYRAIVSQARLKSSEWLAVHGCGGVGLSAVMVGSALGAKIIGVDVNPDALILAKKLGATEIVDSKNAKVVERIVDLTQGGANVSIDAYGSRETCLNSIGSLRKRGRHIQIGLMASADRDCSALWPQVIAKELQLIGSHGISPKEYDSMFELIERGNLNLEDLVQSTVNLHDAIPIIMKMETESPIGVSVITKFS